MMAISGFWLCWTRAAAAQIEAIADDIVSDCDTGDAAALSAAAAFEARGVAGRREDRSPVHRCRVAAEGARVASGSLKARFAWSPALIL